MDNKRSVCSLLPLYDDEEDNDDDDDVYVYVGTDYATLFHSGERPQQQSSTRAFFKSPPLVLFSSRPPLVRANHPEKIVGI